MTPDFVPSWACAGWGGHEHDWLDCPECLFRYEQYLEDDWALEAAEHAIEVARWDALTDREREDETRKAMG